MEDAGGVFDKVWKIVESIVDFFSILSDLFSEIVVILEPLDLFQEVGLVTFDRDEMDVWD